MLKSHLTDNNYASSSSQRVLVMDDDENQRYIFGRALEHAGCQVYPASTIQEARHLLNNNHFDVLLCDVCMDGGRYSTDLIQEYSSELSAQGTEIIMMSAERQYQHLCEAAGLSHFVAKPIGVQPLLVLVSSLIN